jgi:hypothetical protein
MNKICKGKTRVNNTHQTADPSGTRDFIHNMGKFTLKNIARQP